MRPKPGTSEGWLTPGREFVVLELHAAANKEPAMLCIESDVLEPGATREVLFPATDFDMVDARIPSTWEAELDEHGTMTLGPRAWRDFECEGCSFWESFFGDEWCADKATAETRARRVYEAEKAAMIAEDARSRPPV